MSDTIHLFNVGQIEQSGSPEQIYARPQTKFAANFIGHYNILKADELKKRSAYTPESEFVAVRSEAIQISDKPIGAENALMLKGTVVTSMSRGTTVVYTVDCGGLEINADILFSPVGRLANGTGVYLSIPQGDILPLR